MPVQVVLKLAKELPFLMAWTGLDHGIRPPSVAHPHWDPGGFLKQVSRKRLAE